MLGMSAKLSLKEVNRRLRKAKYPAKLADPRIKVCDDWSKALPYVGVGTPCAITGLGKGCGHTLNRVPNNITRNGITRNGSGCSVCSGLCPKTAEDYKAVEETRPIRWVGVTLPQGTGKKTEWLCLVSGCGGRWSTTYSNIQSGKGCPDCKARQASLRYRTPYPKLVEKYSNKLWAVLTPEEEYLKLENPYDVIILCQNCGHERKAKYNPTYGRSCGQCGSHISIPCAVIGLALRKFRPNLKISDRDLLREHHLECDLTDIIDGVTYVCEIGGDYTHGVGAKRDIKKRRQLKDANHRLLDKNQMLTRDWDVDFYAKDIRDIARFYRVDREALVQACREVDLQEVHMLTRNSNKNPTFQAFVVVLYDEFKMTAYEVAELFGVSTSPIHKVLKEFGATRSVSESKGGLTLELRAKAVEQVVVGDRPTKDVAKEFRVSPDTIRRYVTDKYPNAGNSGA
jgi:hypothetical protein